jgi:hypothetical protein
MVRPRAAGTSRPQRTAPLCTRVTTWLVWAWACVTATVATAQPMAAESARAGPSSSGLPGIVYSGVPTGPLGLSLRATAGYGFTSKRALVPNATHRLQGGVAAALQPLDWLGFGLRLDGRLELHGDDGRGSHMSGFGDPRLYVRAGYVFDPEWSIGGEVSAWFPGQDAPSFVAAATSVDGRVLAAYQPRALPLVVLASAGARLDNSAQIAPQRSRTRASDIMTLGISDSNAVLGALGVLYKVDPAWQVFAEFSGDFLVGSRAPRLSDSPLRVAGGARYALAPGWQAEATIIGTLSTRPSLRPEAAWVPIEPRFSVLLGISHSFALFDKPAPAPQTKSEAKNPPPDKPKEPPKPKLASVQGEIVDDHGQPVPDVRVTLTAADGSQQESITDAAGKYQFGHVPYGPAKLEARAVGFTARSWETQVSEPHVTATAPTALAQNVDVGVLRGLVRSFDSKPLQAHVSVMDARGKPLQTRDSQADGRFELELPPGQYKVNIEAQGYRKYTQSVRIKGNGVSVLNADMKAQ